MKNNLDVISQQIGVRVQELHYWPSGRQFEAVVKLWLKGTELPEYMAGHNGALRFEQRSTQQEIQQSILQREWGRKLQAYYADSGCTRLRMKTGSLLIQHGRYLLEVLIYGVPPRGQPYEKRPQPPIPPDPPPDDLLAALRRLYNGEYLYIFHRYQVPSAFWTKRQASTNDLLYNSEPDDNALAILAGHLLHIGDCVSFDGWETITLRCGVWALIDDQRVSITDDYVLHQLTLNEAGRAYVQRHSPQDK